jgi:hypothetical protein
MIHLYTPNVGLERKRRVLNLIASYPYLLRHHIRPGCLCMSSQSGYSIPSKYRLILDEPSIRAVETRYEGDKSCAGGTINFDQLSTQQTKQCIVDIRATPWNLLERRSVLKLQSVANRPLWVCDRLGREIADIPYGPNFTSRERLSLVSKIEKLSDAVGQCERIHQTAVPLNYARHSLRSLTLWLFTLPFALVADLGYLTAPVTAGIAWLLFGVYQIGYSIEDPFQGSLRLSMLCDAIKRDVLGTSNSNNNNVNGNGLSTSSNSPFCLDDTWNNKSNNNDDDITNDVHSEAKMHPFGSSSSPIFFDSQILENFLVKPTVTETSVPNNGTCSDVIPELPF